MIIKTLEKKRKEKLSFPKYKNIKKFTKKEMNVFSFVSVINLFRKKNIYVYQTK